MNEQKVFDIAEFLHQNQEMIFLDISKGIREPILQYNLNTLVTPMLKKCISDHFTIDSEEMIMLMEDSRIRTILEFYFYDVKRYY